MIRLFNSIFRPTEFTGTHMLVIVVSFFTVVIGVNLAMAYFANASWSGLIVHNTYVASQHFDEEVAATRALHERRWASALDVADDRIIYTLEDASGSPVGAGEVVILFQRPASELQDHEMHLLPEQRGRFVSPGSLEAGQWLARIDVREGDTVLFRETRRFVLDGSGAGQ